jgi:transposase
MNVHELVSDKLWSRVERLLPPHPPQPEGGHPWNPDRPALCGIIYVLQTGIGWQQLPTALGCGSGSTCWRRLRDWQAAGVWERLHRLVLDELGAAGAIDWERLCVDSASLPAKKGARRPARTRPTGRNRAASTTW